MGTQWIHAILHKLLHLEEEITLQEWGKFVEGCENLAGTQVQTDSRKGFLQKSVDSPPLCVAQFILRESKFD